MKNKLIWGLDEFAGPIDNRNDQDMGESYKRKQIRHRGHGN